jgi:alpha-glucuronidase
MSERLEFSDDRFVLMALLRYALGRPSYAPSIAVENIKANWTELNISQKEQIIKEIKDYKIDCDSILYGDLVSFDSCWYDVLDLEV